MVVIKANICLKYICLQNFIKIYHELLSFSLKTLTDKNDAWLTIVIDLHTSGWTILR